MCNRVYSNIPKREIYLVHVYVSITCTYYHPNDNFFSIHKIISTLNIFIIL